MPELVLPDHPVDAAGLLRCDAGLASELAGAWVDAGGDPADAPRFLFGFAPVRAFDAALSAGSDAPPGGALVGLTHASGWFGGVWLRAEILRAQPASFLAAGGRRVETEAVEAIAARARDDLALAGGDPEASRTALAARLPELTSTYAYNQGYLQQILEAPPAGCSPGDEWIRPGGPLDCRYGRPRLGALSRLARVAERLAAPPDAAWRAVAEAVREPLETEVARGRQVWSSGLSVEGFDAAAYARLVDVSASFLEVVQATALTACAAVADRDAPAARRAARACAGLGPWLGSYALALLDPSADATGPALPTLA